ncbi:hCG2036819, isoform CRA_a [Homo sapiens]
MLGWIQPSRQPQLRAAPPTRTPSAKRCILCNFLPGCWLVGDVAGSRQPSAPQTLRQRQHTRPPPQERGSGRRSPLREARRANPHFKSFPVLEARGLPCGARRTGPRRPVREMTLPSDPERATLPNPRLGAPAVPRRGPRSHGGRR